MQFLKLFIVCFSILSFSGCANYDNMSQSQKQEFWNGIAGGLQGASDALAEQNRRIDLPPAWRTKVMEQSPLISENSGYETIQIYR